MESSVRAAGDFFAVEEEWVGDFAVSRALAESGGRSAKYPSVLCASRHVGKAVEGSRSRVGSVASEASGERVGSAQVAGLFLGQEAQSPVDNALEPGPTAALF
jgi:hypothetical protein